MDKKRLDELAQEALNGNSSIPIISEEGLKAHAEHEVKKKRADHAMEVMVLAREIISRNPSLDAGEILNIAHKFVQEGQSWFKTYIEATDEA